MMSLTRKASCHLISVTFRFEDSAAVDVDYVDYH